jgi:hypothetical protein
MQEYDKTREREQAIKVWNDMDESHRHSGEWKKLDIKYH